MIDSAAPSSGVYKDASGVVWRSVVALVLAAVTIFVCLWGTPPAGKSVSSVNMNLPEAIQGYWGTNQAVSDAERVLLPKDTEFAKKLYSKGDGEEINCEIVLAGAEKRSIHRPEICLPAQGWTLKSGQVIPIRLKNGKTLQVMKLTIARPVTLRNGQTRELKSLFCYWFIGKDTTTPYHLIRVLKTNLDMLLYNVNHRWAYVVVSAPILEGLVPHAKSESEVLAMLENFISELAPQIMKDSAKH